MPTYWEIDRRSVPALMTRALELLAIVELADKALLPEEVSTEAEKFRAVVSEHVTYTTRGEA